MSLASRAGFSQGYAGSLDKRVAFDRIVKREDEARKHESKESALKRAFQGEVNAAQIEAEKENLKSKMDAESAISRANIDAAEAKQANQQNIAFAKLNADRREKMLEGLSVPLLRNMLGGNLENSYKERVNSFYETNGNYCNNRKDEIACQNPAYKNTVPGTDEWKSLMHGARGQVEQEIAGQLREQDNKELEGVIANVRNICRSNPNANIDAILKEELNRFKTGRVIKDKNNTPKKEGK